MNNSPHNSSIREKVRHAISGGHAKMRGRSYFVFAAALSLLGTIIVSVVLVYLASFIFFTLRYTGVLLLPSFGVTGIGAFIRSLPWVLIIVCILFIVVLEIFVQHYAFAYRQPLLYSILGVVVLITVGGVIIGQTRLHDGLLQHAQAGELPLAGTLYRGYCTKRFPNVHAGIIQQMTENGFRVENRGGETLSITITPRTRFPRGSGFSDGDEVLIFGSRNNGAVEAYGIRAMHEYPRRQGLPDQQRYRILLPQ